MRHPLLRLRAFLTRIRWILAAIAAWLAAACLGFHARGDSWCDAALQAAYVRVESDPWAQGYSFWGQSLLFGVLIALLLRETLENQTERCRHMARLVADHTIIIGYTHLGARLVEHCIKNRLPYVLIEKNRELVDDLVRQGEPVLVDDAKTKDALPAANLAAARRLILASNNIETALLVVRRARQANPSCQITVRCPDDELVEVLEQLGADVVFSSSQAAFQQIAARLQKA
ncbi:MAG: NAD-binding protein [Elusimicrobia bacterium]|nr:NAD-binding protein [Elusimicrobiota bacterium]